MGSNHEKNGGRKSRDTLPLNIYKKKKFLTLREKKIFEYWLSERITS